jgi:hypothetical protein
VVKEPVVWESVSYLQGAGLETGKVFRHTFQAALWIAVAGGKQAERLATDEHGQKQGPRISQPSDIFLNWTEITLKRPELDISFIGFPA